MTIASVAVGIGEIILKELANEALNNQSFEAAFIAWLEGLGARLKINSDVADEIGNALISGARSVVGAIVAGTPAASHVDPEIVAGAALGHGDAVI
jgi:hypothetical protein